MKKLTLMGMCLLGMMFLGCGGDKEKSDTPKEQIQPPKQNPDVLTNFPKDPSKK